MNKRRHRTEQYHKAARRLVVAEEVSNRIEQHNFDKLVSQGVVVEEPVKAALGVCQANLNEALNPVFVALKEKSMLKVEAGGRGRPGGVLLSVPTNP